MRDQLVQAIETALIELLREAGDTAPPPPFTVERPRSEQHGDFACNAAMALAGRLGRPPRDIAEALLRKLCGPDTAEGLIERGEVAGPGFVNLWLAERNWHGVLRALLEAGPRVGRSTHGAGRSVQVEFVSANPTGPLSVGHGRQAVLGDCLARLLEAVGFKVVREYYFNNAGRQMQMLGESLRARYLEQRGEAAPPPEDALDDPALPWPETLDGLPVVFPRDGYRGDYLGEIAAELAAGQDAPVDFQAEAERRIFAQIRSTLTALDIRFDVYTNESSLYESGAVDAALASLEEAGFVKEEEGAVWFCAGRLGLPRDRVVVKSSGDHTYLLPDIAYHVQKIERGFDVIIDVQGADHKDQGPFVSAALSALGRDPECLEFLFHEFVTLSSGGRKLKQSTRRAHFITIDELLEEVGPDVFRYFMIERRAQSHLDFDLELAKERDWTKNPAYYLQYAHARTHGIERQARARGVAMPGADQVDATRLSLPEEIALVKKLGEFAPLVERAALSRQPHHLAHYLREVAGLWNPYVQDGVRHRVLGDDAGLTAARLGLTLAVRHVLAAGLGLLGMNAPERM